MKINTVTMTDEEEFYNSVGKDSEVKSPRLTGHGRDRGRNHEIWSEPVEVAGHSIKKAQTGSMWAQNGDNSFFSCDHAVDTLPSGMYICIHSDYAGFGLKAVPKVCDELLTLPDTANESVINELKHFWTRQSQFKQYGFLWKRGVLLYGPPGSGKSSTVTQICDYVHTHLNGLTIQVFNPELAAKCLATVRMIEPNRLIVVILEDIDDILYHHGESATLSLMDGETQINNIVFIATTNYPERIDARFVNRPSRFDVIKKIGMPSLAARELFFKIKVPTLTPEELTKWAKVTDGFSVAHMKEIIVSVCCLGNDFEDTVARLKKMIKQKLSSEEFGEGGFGFSNNRD